MVLLEFKMCLSRCSYCIGCWREWESHLNSLASHNSSSEDGKETVKQLNLTPQSTVDSIESVIISSL